MTSRGCAVVVSIVSIVDDVDVDVWRGSSLVQLTARLSVRHQPTMVASASAQTTPAQPIVAPIKMSSSSTDHVDHAPRPTAVDEAMVLFVR